MRLAQVALRATDLDRAQAWWSRLLESEPTGRFEPPGLLFFDLDGTRLLLDAGAPPSLVYIQVDDVAATLARLGDDVRVESEPHVIVTHEDDSLGPAGTREWQAFVRDQDDNLVGLVSHEAI